MEKKNINCSFELKAISEDDNFFTFEGHASTHGNTDRGNDIVMKGAFTESIKELNENAINIPNTNMRKLMPVLWQHNSSEPIGSFIEVREDNKGLFVKAILPKDDSLVSGRVIPQMKAGSVSAMSIGFMIQEATMDNDGVRQLEKLELFETSLVTIPMNPEANVTAFKSLSAIKEMPMANRSYEWDKKEAIERLNALSTEDSNSAFIFKELPIADVIEGKLTIIPKAIFSVAIALSNSALEISEDEKSALMADINSYYEKMGLDSPFIEKHSCFRIDDFNSLTEREMEKAFKSGVLLEGENAKKVVSAIKSMKRDADLAKKRDVENVDSNINAQFDEILNLLKKD